MSKSKFLKMDNLSLQHILDDDADLIPLMTPEDEEEINREEIPDTLPILPLRNTVLFPGVVIPITAGRDKSIELIKEAYKGNKIIGVVAQKNESIEDPTINDIYKVGTVARILRMLKMPDGNTTVIIQGKKPFEIDSFVQEEPYLQAITKPRKEDRSEEREPEFDAIISKGAYLPCYVGGEKGGPTQSPTISAVGYNSLLTGTWTNKHGVVDNDIKTPNYNYPTIFKVFKEQYPSKKIGVFSTWLDNRTKLVGDGLAQTSARGY